MTHWMIVDLIFDRQMSSLVNQNPRCNESTTQTGRVVVERKKSREQILIAHITKPGDPWF